MLRVAALILLLGGCSYKPGERLDSLFESARADLQAGELQRAQLESERGAALSKERRDEVYRWKFLLLHAEILLNSRRAEEVLSQLAEPIPQAAQFASLAARKKMLEGQAQSILGRNEESDRLLNQALNDAAAAKADDVALETDTILGATLLLRGHYDQAERVLRSGLERARSSRSAYPEAAILLNLGMIRYRSHRCDDAATYFEQASAVANPRFQVVYSVAQNNLALCYVQLGEVDRAIRIQLEGIARYERSGAKFFLPNALGAAGESYLVKGDFEHAIRYLQRALGSAIEINRPAAAATWAGILSAVHIEMADWRNADAFNQEAVRLKGSDAAKTMYENLLNSARIAAGKGESEPAAHLYQQALAEGKDDPSAQWEAHEGLGILAHRRGDLAGATREFEAALGVLERTRADLLRTEFKLPFLTRRIRLYQQYVDALLAQGQLERALAVADSSRAQVLAERAGAEPVRRLPPGAFSNLAQQSGSILLSYWLTPSQSHVWVVTPREIHHVALPPANQIEPLVAQYQEAIERRLADPLRTRIAAGAKLYETLIAPVLQWLPAGARVVIVPDGALHNINFEALPVPGDAPHYFIRDATLQIAPSLAIWGKVAAHAGSQRLLLLGDPATNDPGFPQLAHAAREIGSVKQNFLPSAQVVLTRESATPQAYLAAASGPFAAIHFTAHAIANRESPLESAVLLSGGKLYARDVMDQPLQADLVTISACRGAGQRTYSGEGLVGFAWAFLRAGARHVIAGLWDVNDQSTADLMGSLYRELAAGKPPADALRTAKLAMIESRGNLRKPYYWAPFQLYTVAP
jgi:CHAT domain-containing protein